MSGRRHPAWQKIKFVRTEEFVVGGWTDPRQSRTHFGALLLGYYLRDEERPAAFLVYAPLALLGLYKVELGILWWGLVGLNIWRVFINIKPSLWPQSIKMMNKTKEVINGQNA